VGRVILGVNGNTWLNKKWTTEVLSRDPGKDFHGYGKLIAGLRGHQRKAARQACRRAHGARAARRARRIAPSRTRRACTHRVSAYLPVVGSRTYSSTRRRVGEAEPWRSAWAGRRQHGSASAGLVMLS
jgi:hypothetical protein